MHKKKAKTRTLLTIQRGVVQPESKGDEVDKSLKGVSTSITVSVSAPSFPLRFSIATFLSFGGKRAKQHKRKKRKKYILFVQDIFFSDFNFPKKLPERQKSRIEILIGIFLVFVLLTGV